MTGWIGISIGDVTGIGPEVTLKAVALERSAGASFLLIGDAELLRDLNHQLKLDLRLETYQPHLKNEMGQIAILDPADEKLSARPGAVAGSPAMVSAALSWLAEGARRSLKGDLDALITAPVNKAAILRSGRPFVGQTEFLSDLAGTGQTAMMLLGEDDLKRWLRVALVTTHIPLRTVAASLEQSRIEQVIGLTVQACFDLGLSRASVAVCGLNPHAGEDGQLGNEEETIISPAVEAARASGHDVVGPLPADTVFYYALRGKYDAIVAMYHDQALAPLKMLCFETGVNWTLGLPFIRTSPDHGTARDIAGQGVADPSSMRAAIRLAQKLIRSRR